VASFPIHDPDRHSSIGHTSADQARASYIKVVIVDDEKKWDANDLDYDQ